MGNDIAEKFRQVDTSDFPDFYAYEKIIEKGLWILWLVKEKLGIKKLTAKQIASIIVDVKGISTNEGSIAQAFRKAGDKIHVHQEDDGASYEIM